MSFLLAVIASAFESDATLAARIAGGDPSALRRLYDRLAGRVRAVALRVLGRAVEADDVVQDTFVDVWGAAATYDPARGSLATWVTTIAQRRALDRLRRRGTRPLGDATLDELPVTGAGPHESVAEQQARARVVRALEQLTAEQRAAIELMYFRGLSQSETATELGVALGTLKSRVRAAMERLGDLLDEGAVEVAS